MHSSFYQGVYLLGFTTCFRNSSLADILDTVGEFLSSMLFRGMMLILPHSVLYCSQSALTSFHLGLMDVPIISYLVAIVTTMGRWSLIQGSFNVFHKF